MKSKQLKREHLSTQKGALSVLQEQFGESNNARLLQSVLLFETGQSRHARLFEHIRYSDGRLAYFSAYSTIEGWTIRCDHVCPMIADLFTGAKRMLKHSEKQGCYILVDSVTNDGEYFLYMFDCLDNVSGDIKFFRIDNLAIEEIASIEYDITDLTRRSRCPGNGCKLLLNTLNPRVFIIQSNFTSRFQLGRVVDNKIEMAKIKCHHRHTRSFEFSKFEGQTLVSLETRDTRINGYKRFFVETNLITEAEILTEVYPATPETDSECCLTEPYCWRGQTLYVTQYDENKLGFFAFDRETLLYHKINIELNNEKYYMDNSSFNYLLNPHAIFVSKDDVLIFHANYDKRCEEAMETFRFPLKKPDTLQNITWLTIRNLARFCGRKDMLKFCQTNQNAIQPAFLPDKELEQHLYGNDCFR